MLPTRYLFNHTHLLMQPSVYGPIFWDDPKTEKRLELTFADYVINDLIVHNDYDIVDIIKIVDYGENDWRYNFVATIDDLHLIKHREHFMSDGISYITSIFSYEDIVRMYFDQLLQIKNKLLWRPPDEPFLNIRYHHKNIKTTWLNEGF